MIEGAGDNTWDMNAGEYRRLIEDPGWDSRYIREQGLIPNMLDLLGDCQTATLLDVGTGTGWLFDHIEPAKAYACDVVMPTKLPPHVMFSRCDVQRLDFAAKRFDVVVASLLLFYCPDLNASTRELYRVAKAGGGRLVVSLMHPYFYRTGLIDERGRFCVTSDLSAPFERTFKIADQVGPFIYYYRPLPHYVNALISAGWRVTELRDWSLDMSRYNQHRHGGLKSEVQRTGSVPLFHFISCVKD